MKRLITNNNTLFVMLAIVLSLSLVVFAVPAMPVAAQGALDADPAGGTVYAWGDNAYGELGNGITGTNSNTPGKVEGLNGHGFLSGVTAIAGGGSGFSLALTSAGVVYAWGGNSEGQLGNGTYTDSFYPVQVSIPSGVRVTAISAGAYNSLALTSAGTVYAWGGTDNIPVQVVGPGGTGYLRRVTAISEGYTHSLALTSAGTVYAWGDNEYGQLGNGNYTDSPYPVQVNIPRGVRVTAIAAGVKLSLALTSAGTVYACGSIRGASDIPGQVVGPGGTGYLRGITAIAGHGTQGLALTSTSTVYAWGGIKGPSAPVEVVGPGGTGYLRGVTGIAEAIDFSLALTSAGTVYAWGGNPSGQLGNETYSDSPYPVQVVGPGGTGYLNGVTAIAGGGGGFSLAIIRHLRR